MVKNLQLRSNRLMRFSIIALVAAMLAGTSLVSGQSSLVTVTIRLRNSQGSPIAGEAVILEQMSDGAPSSNSGESELPACVTGVDGVCSWQVISGIYQLFFDRPLDEVTRLALAEGGLRGYGITVGDESVSYHFTFHHDGFVYFDSDPLAPRPAAIIPSLEDLHLEYAAPVTATTLPIETGEAPAAPLAETPASATALQVAGEREAGVPFTAWLILLSVTAGLILAVALPLVLRSSRLRPISSQTGDRRVTHQPQQKISPSTPTRTSGDDDA